jgi:proteasome lid subunit RPN8/RPN11
MIWQDKALEHAKQEAPNEACGLVYMFKGREKYAPAKNIAVDKLNQFTIDPRSWAETEDKGDIVAVFHSHVNCDATPSDADKYSSEKQGLKYYIVNPKSNEWQSYEPVGYKNSLIGRPYVFGVYDCWSLVRDYFKEQGIIMRDWVRPANEDDFLDNPMFEDCFEATGFRELKYDEQLQTNDCLLLSIYGNGLNHIAVFIDGEVLHHIQGRLSGREPYGEWLQKCTGKRIRYVA